MRMPQLILAVALGMILANVTLGTVAYYGFYFWSHMLLSEWHSAFRLQPPVASDPPSLFPLIICALAWLALCVAVRVTSRRSERTESEKSIIELTTADEAHDDC